MSEQIYLTRKVCHEWPRIPLSAHFDLTYRCNFNCRHCWLRLPPQDPKGGKELTHEEILRLFDESRSLGCRHFYLSGGEPMLRDDFMDLFDCVSSQAAQYSLNTNGTLITPQIARLMKRHGQKWIALYGADEAVCDHITRTPGSFDAVLRGMRRLREAGAGFMVQIVLMRDNIHQFGKMVDLAESMSPDWRLGPSWFYLSADRDESQNQSIRSQRLTAQEILTYFPPEVEAQDTAFSVSGCGAAKEDDGLFSSCIRAKRDFHVDPYGQMSFCSMVKDDQLRLDLKTSSLRDAWDSGMARLVSSFSEAEHTADSCESCRLQADCHPCPVYSFLEHGNYRTPVEDLCSLQSAHAEHKKRWDLENRRFFNIAGFNIEVNSEQPFPQEDFLERFVPFRSIEGARDMVLSHHFSLPSQALKQPGTLLFQAPPYFIYRHGNSWVFHARSSEQESPYQVIVASHDFSRVRIYHQNADFFLSGRLSALTMMSSDQILLALFLANHSAMILHSSAVVYHHQGLLFIGHSEAGKSTMAKLLSGQTTLLCDDRNIIRREGDGFRVYGTWSHGEIPMVANHSAPLKGIYFLRKGSENRIEPVSHRFDAVKQILACLIRPYCDAEWWQNILSLIEDLVRQVPCYDLYFDRSGHIVPELLASHEGNEELFYHVEKKRN